MHAHFAEVDQPIGTLHVDHNVRGLERAVLVELEGSPLSEPGRKGWVGAYGGDLSQCRDDGHASLVVPHLDWITRTDNKHTLCEQSALADRCIDSHGS